MGWVGTRDGQVGTCGDPHPALGGGGPGGSGLRVTLTPPSCAPELIACGRERWGVRAPARQPYTQWGQESPNPPPTPTSFRATSWNSPGRWGGGWAVRGESVPEMSPRAWSCCSCPHGRVGLASTGGRLSRRLFLTLLLRLLAQVHTRCCPPVGPGVPHTVKSPSHSPQLRPGCHRAVQDPMPRQPPPEASPCSPLLCRSPQTPDLHPSPGEVPLRARPRHARAGLGGPGRPHLASGQRCWDRGQAGSGESGWWVQGRAINGLPRAGPPLRKGMESSSDQWGHRDLPTCPAAWPGPAATAAAIQAKKSWEGVLRLGWSI